jgi:hypothetical protein
MSVVMDIASANEPNRSARVAGFPQSGGRRSSHRWMKAAIASATAMEERISSQTPTTSAALEDLGR